MALRPVDVIAGARIDGQPNAYVLGCFDTRITFYSQQVRALELAYSLNQQHHVASHQRIAVIGGGAGGATIAAALALQSEANVFLYERSDVLMPLQRESQRRRLDPHIYDWPGQDSDQEFAELPIMDWKSGPAVNVRDSVCREFNEICATVGGQLHVHVAHEVTSVVPKATGFDIYFTREGRDGNREVAQSEAEIVIFAFGFGVELQRPIPHTVTESYWRDAGVPGPEIDGNARPRFFVSGNGDGGLIDLVAAASARFDHDATIRSIAKRKGVRALSDRLIEIDVQARAADAIGNGFDFVAAYDATIAADAAAMGLVDELAARLRPGVQLFFQTREPELMSIRTATLNRLVVYLVIKACRDDPTRAFEHIVCENVVALDPPAGFGQPAFLFECNGRQIAADKVIVRRGPGRAAVRAPFEGILEGYEQTHRDWISNFPNESIAPNLSEGARKHFVRLARARQLPLPRYRHAELEAQLPQRVKVSLRGQSARWSGDIGIANAIEPWSTQPRHLQLNIEANPEELGALSFAIARLAIHCRRCTLFLDVPRWQPFLERLSSSSLNAGGLPLPNLQAEGENVSILNSIDISISAMAVTLNRAFDDWVLNAIDLHLRDYLVGHDDPGSIIGFKVADDLKEAMLVVWTQWRESFVASPEALARFLRLVVCAHDTAEHEREAQVLVGPLKLRLLVRATAVALAIATAWQVMVPRGEVPGNLAQSLAGTLRIGHACAAELIDGEPTEIRAAQFMWKTHFVVLPMINSTIGITLLADASFIETESKVPRLDEVDDGAMLVLTIDSAFRVAAQHGRAALGDFLAAAEGRHFKRLIAPIEKVAEIEGML